MQDAVTNMALFAASTNLAAPLPPNYVTAADAMQVALWKWTCPFTALSFTDDTPYPAPPTLVEGPVTTVNSSTPVNFLDRIPQSRGRKLLSADSPVTRVLCGGRFADDVKRLEQARAFSHYRSLLQSTAPSQATKSTATLPGNRTVLVTIVAQAPGINQTSRELPSEMYPSLLNRLEALADFLQGNVPNSKDKG
jgi:hypothetical protein